MSYRNVTTFFLINQCYFYQIFINSTFFLYNLYLFHYNDLYIKNVALNDYLVQHFYIYNFILTDGVVQISLAYLFIVLSLENIPE
jgi:hypothetical protein